MVNHKSKKVHQLEDSGSEEDEDDSSYEESAYRVEQVYSQRGQGEQYFTVLTVEKKEERQHLYAVS